MLPGSLKCHFFDQVATFATTWCALPAIAIVHNAKRLDLFSTLGELRGPHTSGPTVVVAMCRTQGGGAKNETYKHAKAALAKELLDHGYPVQVIESITADWITKVGVNAVARATKLRDPDKRWAELIELAKWHGASLEANEQNRQQAAKVIQAAVRVAQRHEPSVEDFRLVPGFFTNKDKSPAVILSGPSCGQRGVALVDAETATNWLSRSRPIVTDECALVTLGRQESLETFGPVEIHFPACDKQDREVLLRGCLWQLGESPVLTSVANHTIDTTSTIRARWPPKANQVQATMPKQPDPAATGGPPQPGPTAARLQSFDDRMTQLEQCVKSLGTGQQQFQAQCQESITGIVHRVGAVETQLQKVTTGFQHTLNEAITQQNKRMDSGFDEIKASQEGW